jgi:hypothetical protein
MSVYLWFFNDTVSSLVCVALNVGIIGRNLKGIVCDILLGVPCWQFAILTGQNHEGPESDIKILYGGLNLGPPKYDSGVQ